MIYDILEKKLITAGLGRVGVDIFREHMPAHITKGVMFRSPLAGINVDPGIPGFYKPRLQVIVRHTDNILGNKLSSDVVRALLVEAPEVHDLTEVGRVLVSIFTPTQLPIQFPRMDGNAIEWSLNFQSAFSFKPTWT